MQAGAPQDGVGCELEEAGMPSEVENKVKLALCSMGLSSFSATIALGFIKVCARIASARLVKARYELCLYTEWMHKGQRTSKVSPDTRIPARQDQPQPRKTIFEPPGIWLRDSR
jgi:hypothetical protein